MIDARHRWVFPDPTGSTRRSAPPRGSRASGPSPRPSWPAAGSRTPTALAAFLGPAIAGLNDPAAPAGRAAACSPGSPRPATRGERVMVFGDFDADGLTGLAQLVLAFRRLGIAT